MADDEKGGPSKEDQERIKDTNVEGIGSKENRDLRKAAAETEKAWEGAGKEPGLQIWRIEKFKVKHWPKDKYGEFHTGDSYIILQTIKNDEGGFDYNVFFWLGSETSQDEAGTAAYKTVELDDLLGDEPVQYREVQGNESSLFLKMFKHLTVLPGGVASGFRKVTDEKWKPSLHSVVGNKKNVQVYDVTSMGVKALNNEDAFILDLERDKIFVFIPEKASPWEKRQANAEVQLIKGKPGRGKAKDIHIDGLEDESKEYDPFWEWMGGKPAKLPDAEDQVVAEREMCMIKISDDDGTLKAEQIHKGSLQKTKMESDDAYILDTGISLYVWIGKTANKEEKKLAMKHTMEYMKENNLPMHLPVCRVIEGKEPKHFHAMMKDCEDGKWDAKMMKGGYCGRKSSKAVRKDKK